MRYTRKTSPEREPKHACHPTASRRESRLDELAQATGRSKSFYVREARIEHLDEREDLYLAWRELAAIRAGKPPPAVALAEVTKRHGLQA